jgi:uncharacterized ferritin-like protein (DUF455 family)
MCRESVLRWPDVPKTKVKPQFCSCLKASINVSARLKVGLTLEYYSWLALLRHTDLHPSQ